MIHHNFTTHYDSWRRALERMVELGDPGEDGKDTGYWRHELKAFDESYTKNPDGVMVPRYENGCPDPMVFVVNRQEQEGAGTDCLYVFVKEDEATKFQKTLGGALTIEPVISGMKELRRFGIG